ncbi:MAG: alpha/beta hydrolase [Clostridia bacterium]|jgi:lysophospholipase|nr:alpha/beta hydrolase [Clostridia bacterium]
MVKEFRKNTYDGIELYAKVDSPENPKAVIIIVHGLCEHQGRYDYVTQYLNSQNFKVYRYDHRGHGRSKGHRTYFPNREAIIEDLKVFVDMATEENPSLPVFLLGHSMGGYAVNFFGTKYPGVVRGIISCGAWSRDTDNDASIPDGLDPLAYVENTLSVSVCTDPAVVEAYNNDPLVEKKISFGLFYAGKKGHEWMVANAKRFTDSVFVLHGLNDELIPERISREFFADIGSTDKTLIIYSGLGHEILNEPSKDRILGHITEWLNDRI